MNEDHSTKDASDLWHRGWGMSHDVFTAIYPLLSIMYKPYGIECLPNAEKSRNAIVNQPIGENL